MREKRDGMREEGNEKMDRSEGFRPVADDDRDPLMTRIPWRTSWRSLTRLSVTFISE